MKKETTNIVLNEKIKLLIEEWGRLANLTEKYGNDTSNDGAHEWAVQNLQRIEKDLAKHGISYSQIPEMQKKIKKEKLRNAIYRIKNKVFTIFHSKNKQNI